MPVWGTKRRFGALGRVACSAFAATPLLAATLALSACSINGVGFASADVLDANGARIVRTRTYGVALRTAAEEAGLTIGYSWTLALIPDCPGAPSVGTHWFGVPMSGLRPIASVRRTSGLAIDANRRTAGVMLGYAEDGVFSRPSADESIVRHLVLTPDEPSNIEFYQSPEGSSCR